MNQSSYFLGLLKIFLAFLIFIPYVNAESKKSKVHENFIKNPRQLTFAGKRSGEGYFSSDGKKLVYQSERLPENPFYQIFTIDLETGDSQQISNGKGKNTCAWFHPDGTKVLYASTHHDPHSKKYQEAELNFRKSGKKRRYAWDYDPEYELYTTTLKGESKRLSHVKGYDAECAYSPDGKWIVFASNRHAYTEKLSKEDQALFKKDPSSMMEIYIMDAEGNNVKRLTNHIGYDGGPFFNAKGDKICWRRFSKDGLTAEIFTMTIDGKNQKALTKMGVMSWAPYFHPSDQYLIFTSNKLGFANFELFIVDINGQKEPLRVSFSDGFDGLPVFSPDGKKLVWTSKRSSNRSSQLFMANWNHSAVLEKLNLQKASKVSSGIPTKAPSFNTKPEINEKDLYKHVAYLASEKLEGRMTGTEGERLATAYAKEYLEKLGFEAEYQSFDFTSGARTGENNKLSLTIKNKKSEGIVNDNWRPLVYSKTGKIPAASIVFAGYGLVAPKAEGVEEYDSYVHLDVKGKWVMVFRYMPENATEKQRMHWNRHISLRYKSMVARDRGAVGLIVVSGPNSKVKHELIPLNFDASMSGTSIAVVSIKDVLAKEILASAGKDIQQLQNDFDKAEVMMGIQLPDTSLEANIDVIHEIKKGRNVIAKWKSGQSQNVPLMIGAHIDHLGKGHKGSDSLATGHEKDSIHYGADDNASGVAGVLEIAEWVSKKAKKGELKLKRDLWIGLWSGEEIGLLGSNHFIKQFKTKVHAHKHHHSKKTRHSTHHHKAKIKRKFAAYLNLDMVGRLDKKLILQGTGSSSKWMSLIEQANVPVGLGIETQDDSYLPTDATPFYISGTPILSAFTGAHKDYHTPRDTIDKVNFPGTAKITKLIALIARKILLSETLPDYKAMQKPENMKRRAHLRAYLGTIPDYASGKDKGVLLSGASKGGPADKAGLKGGDIIVELAGKKIDNIYDYTYAIEALKPMQKVKVKIKREGKVMELDLTTGARE